MKKFIVGVGLALIVASVAWAGFESEVIVTKGFVVETTDPDATSFLLTSSPTVTIVRTSGKYLILNCTNNVFITADTNGPNIAMFRLDVKLNQYSLTWDTNAFMSTNLTSIITNKYNVIIGVRPYGGGLFEVR